MKEVTALQRHARKCEAKVKAELAELRAGVNVVAMASALEGYAPLRKAGTGGVGQQIAAELAALQDRRSALLARLQPPEQRSAAAAAAAGTGAGAGDGEALAGLAAAAVQVRRCLSLSVRRLPLPFTAVLLQARAMIVSLLGSTDMVAVTDALDRYEYLGGGADQFGLAKLLHQLHSRRVLLGAAPRKAECEWRCGGNAAGSAAG